MVRNAIGMVIEMFSGCIGIWRGSRGHRGIGIGQFMNVVVERDTLMRSNLLIINTLHGRS